MSLAESYFRIQSLFAEAARIQTAIENIEITLAKTGSIVLQYRDAGGAVISEGNVAVTNTNKDELLTLVSNGGAARLKAIEAELEPLGINLKRVKPFQFPPTPTVPSQPAPAAADDKKEDKKEEKDD